MNVLVNWAIADSANAWRMFDTKPLPKLLTYASLLSTQNFMKLE